MAEEEERESESVEIPIGKVFNKVGFSRMRENPWIVSTLVLGVAFILVLVLGGFGGITGNAVSSANAGQNLIDFINSQGSGQATLTSAEKEGSLYNVNVNYNGQDIPVYVTLDGKYAFMLDSAIPLTSDSINTGSTPQQTEVPKSDKPKVELFVMSYCPYGTQMEKGILPVLGLLGDKIDATIRYTHFTLHGEKEDTENFRQICIREEQGGKFLKYIQCTLNSTDVNAPADVNKCMQSLGINVPSVNTCMKNKAAEYYAVDSQLSQSYGVQGSPTLVINGVQADSGRSPAAVLGVICSSFNNAPAECSQELSTSSPSAGFGYQSGSSADSAAANCAF